MMRTPMTILFGRPSPSPINDSGSNCSSETFDYMQSYEKAVLSDAANLQDVPSKIATIRPMVVGPDMLKISWNGVPLIWNVVHLQ